MIKNYFKTAWRNIVKNKFYSLINVLGLTLGLAIGILILMWVQDELSFDRFHSRARQIYQVNSPVGSGATIQIWNTTQAPVAAYALKEMPGVINAVRILKNYDYAIFSYKDKVFNETGGAYIDPSLLKIFDFKLLQGDRNKPFLNDQSVLITKSTAEKYFGNENPMGKVIQGDHKDNFTVSGVLADFPDNSSIRCDMFFSMNLRAKQYTGDSFWKTMDNDWGNFGYTTFLEVRPGTDLKSIGQKLIAIQAKNAPQIKVSLTEDAFQLQPLSDIHLQEADGKSAAMQTVKIFLVIAILILLIASINYVNLSTARAMLRAKEVSIRKIVGAEKSQLFAQFIIESTLFFLVSLILALALIILLIPYYNSISGKHLHLNLLDYQLWKIVSITCLGTLLTSAVYPSILLSSFEPLKALKGKLSLGIGNAVFRKVLVTTQFIFSVALIISTLVIGRQLKYIQEKNPGYDRSQVFSFPAGAMQDHLEAVKAELSNQSSIKTVAVSNGNVVNNLKTTGGAEWDGKDVNNVTIVHPMGIDEKFIPALKMQLIAGTNFTGAKLDSAHYILNETAVKMTGLKNPIGKRFKLWQTEGTIIGIVKDFNFASLKEKIEPSVLFYSTKGFNIYVKTSGKQAPEAIAAVSRLWKQYNPGFPFEYTFLDDKYNALYKSDQTTGSLFNIFSGIAILISCLGLFGLVTYSAQIKTREIGIRKVLGASVASIVSLISKDFLRLVVIAIVVASPIAWISMKSWLQSFAYRIDISLWVFIIAGASAIVITLITISFQSIKAALSNPVMSLRSE
ncbi:MAG TPA: ABC transporter permease [Mucilaginibacter sp.]|nr:ABC transporter permease [Mucilaginibacter sp.]